MLSDGALAPNGWHVNGPQRWPMTEADFEWASSELRKKGGDLFYSYKSSAEREEAGRVDVADDPVVELAETLEVTPDGPVGIACGEPPGLVPRVVDRSRSGTFLRRPDGEGIA